MFKYSSRLQKDAVSCTLSLGQKSMKASEFPPNCNNFTFTKAAHSTHFVGDLVICLLCLFCWRSFYLVFVTHLTVKYYVISPSNIPSLLNTYQLAFLSGSTTRIFSPVAYNLCLA